MKTGKDRLKRSGYVRLLVLVPHRDARLPLRAWSASLFAAGVEGAWSFPWVAPVARLKRPLSAEELKSLARALRRHCIGEGGLFTLDPPTASSLSFNFGGEAASVYGPALHTELPADFFLPAAEAVASRISPLVIGTALVHGPLAHDSIPPPPQVSFRAAALANMIYRETGGNLIEWKIGPLHWLPKK